VIFTVGVNGNEVVINAAAVTEEPFGALSFVNDAYRVVARIKEYSYYKVTEAPSTDVPPASVEIPF
jgi:hypothetical protein